MFPWYYTRNAKETQKESGRKAGKGRPLMIGSTDSLKPIKPQERTTQSIVAKFAGVSHDTLRKAEELVEAAEKEPDDSNYCPRCEKPKEQTQTVSGRHRQRDREGKMI